MRLKFISLCAFALISLHASASDGADSETSVVYDFNPVETEYSHSAENDVITSVDILFTFAEAVYSDWFKLLSLNLRDADNNVVRASFRANANGSYSNQSGVIIDSKALEYGVEYSITFPQGTYGDAEWFGETSDQPKVSGHANPEFEVKFTLTNSESGVGEISGGGNKAREVYNIYGVRVGESVDNLPAGIYVVDGKKTIVR